MPQKAKKILLAIFFTCLLLQLHAQNPLPDFKVENLGKNRIKIGWKNNYGNNCIQINVQRSFDSTRFFRTIFSPLSPELPENGFVDNNIFSAGVYYRIFYVLQDGLYFFTASKHPATGFDATEEMIQDTYQDFIVTINLEDSVIAQLHYPEFKIFRDSIVNKTRDSLFVLAQNQVLLKKFDSNNIWIPSMYIFTNSDGNVNINLPDAGKKKYSVKIFDGKGKPLFVIHHVPETMLMLDKTNFMHAGWFTFELYEDDKLKERNKFYLQKDF